MSLFESEERLRAPLRHEPELARPERAATVGRRWDADALIALQRSAGNAAVSRALAGRTGPTAVALARFPHRAKLEERLGRAVSGDAVVDPERCAAVGAEAFTEGTRTSFATPEPRLEVAAHEAAHQLQHAGVTRDAGLGPEAHAQKIARAIAADRSAAPLISERGSTVAPALRRYTEVDPNNEDHRLWDTDGTALRVADDGTMAVRQDSSYGSHQLWATSGRIYSAANMLRDRGSLIKLSLGNKKITGRSPTTNQDTTLWSVDVANAYNGTNGTTMDLWADCGKAARTIMGVGPGTPRGTEGIKAKYTKDGTEKTTQASQPKAMADEIIKNTLGKNTLGNSTKDGWRRYWALSTADRDRFDQDHGLNKYAEPEVGGGYTIASGGANYPGKATWNFHWAGVIMSTGTDHVTLENFAVGDPSVQNTDWDFQMYGPPTKGGQTFHEQHRDTQQHGQTPTTMAVGQK